MNNERDIARAVPPRLHLASSSPRRREILEALGLAFTAAGVGVDETPAPGEDASAMVERLAAAKALAADAADGCVVIGADTAVVLGSKIYGKPRDEADALGMLAELSGRTHVVMTGVAVRSEQGIARVVSTSEVSFREIRPDEARRYWHSGEPADKAGAYAIQGRGGVFVTGISGSYSGIVGLPVFETAELLQRAGVHVLDRSGNQR